ncbi:vacuolar protein sorting-associated protein 18 homolog [Cyclospora cayetanensis]|uniref:Vacuolar protein sorting-associated protein 18 homolog n=1 Tax=Cyclospora cayetanensis TaxID=88456 RepID=A0A6P6S223_9EIME|nr:vacuolar protein sorting-associated protein 18 homolog [Cyclospora cayetanensis]
MECTVAGGKERHLRLLMQLPKSSPALDISVVSVGAGSESCVAVLVATDSELLCFQGVGGVAAAFSSNPNKNPPAALSEAVAYEVSSGSAAGPAATANASSSLAVDRTSSTDPQTAVFTVYWLTPMGLLIGELRLPAAPASLAAAGSGGNLLSFPPEVVLLPAAPLVAAASSNSTAAAAAAADAAVAAKDALNPQHGPVPLAFVATSRHFLFLFEHCIVAYSKISRQYSMSLPLPQHLYGKALQLLHDTSSICSSNNSSSSSSKGLVLLTTEFAAHLLLRHEDANVWELLLASQDYTGALAACNTTQQREIVQRSKARQLLQQQQWVAAAAALACCYTVGFDDACCLLLQLQQQLPQQQQQLLHALRVYVAAKLQQLADTGPRQKVLHKTYQYLAPGHRPSPQQVVLFTWLLRLLLQQLNSIDAEALRAASPPLPPKTSAAAAETNVALEPSVATGGSSNEAALGEALQRTQQEIRHLLTEFKHVDELHGTVVSLLQSSGRTGLLRDFLLMRGDEETCARLFLNSAQYRDALDAILAIQNIEIRNSLFVSYAPLLLLHRPQHFAAAAKRPELATLEPWRLLPALLLPITMLQRDQQQQEKLQPQSSTRSYACWRAAVQLAKHFTEAHMNKPGMAFPFVKGSALSASGAPASSSSNASGTGSCSWASSAGVSTALLLLLAEAPDVSEEDLTSVIGNGGGGFDALLCLRHCQEKNRRRGVILLYVHLKRYQEAVRMALDAADVPLAEEAASNCGDEVLKRNLWLDICRYIGEREDVASLLALVERSKHCIKIQDLLPLLPDAALLRDVGPALREAAASAQRSSSSSNNALQQHLVAIRDLKDQLQAVNQKCVLIDADHLCDLCGAAVICSKFFAFRCGHCMHATCVQALQIPAMSPEELSRFDRSVEALAVAMQENSSNIEALEDAVDGFLSRECPLCGSLMIRSIHVPLVDPNDTTQIDAWTLDPQP